MLVNNFTTGGTSGNVIHTSAPTSGQNVDSSAGSNNGSQGANSAFVASRDYNNEFNIAQSSALNAFNAKEAQKQRDWQERMSNTAHQREVQDLIAAGLNPVLSAMGQGATTPSGGVASGSKATADTTLSEGLITMMAAMISASSAQSIAAMQIENQRYMAANYPSSMYGFLNTLLSGENSGWKNFKNKASNLWNKYYDGGKKGFIGSIGNLFK